MHAKQMPMIGSWYQSTGGPLLKIVAIDSDDETIEIQYLDEAIEEYDFDSWYGMETELIDCSDNLSYIQYDIDSDTSITSLLDLVDNID